MITVTSNPTYTSKDQKMIVYETVVQVEVEDSPELMAELQAVLRSILSSAQLKLEDAIRISEIMAQEADTLSENVKRMMREEHTNEDQDKDT